MLKRTLIYAVLTAFTFVSAQAAPQEELPPVLQKQETATQQAEPVRLKPAKPAPINASTMLISKKNASLGKKAKKAVKLSSEWQNRPVMPSFEEKDGSVVFTYGATQPVLVCKPLRVCVIQLEPGEKIIEKPHCGDTGRWQITPSNVSESSLAPHLFVKPLDSGLTTNLAISTDRRTYIILLKSRNDKYTPLISFRYPENEQQAWEAHLANQQSLEKQQRLNNRFASGGLTFDAENLDFDYTVKGEARWKPLRVFNDQEKTYLKMPKAMKMYEAPVLLTVNDGKEALVNYRLHDDLFIVDQLFDKAVLLSGVGSHQTKITVTHKNVKAKEEPSDESSK